MASPGFDWGLGATNIDHETGIRYGVIPMHDITQSWCDAAESDYGPASCGECGAEAVEIDDVPFDLDDCKVVRQDGNYIKHDVLSVPQEHREEIGDEWRDGGRGYACLGCARSFDSEDAYGDEPVYGFNVDDGEYKAHQAHDDPDVFVLASPYYTNGPFCSPCAPGAVYLRNGIDAPDLEVGQVYGRDKAAGAPAYCFAPDWFDAYDEESVTGEYCGAKTSCPYAVFRVADGVCVFVPNKGE